MPRDIPVGNGNLLVSFGNCSLIRDLYFPHIGLENHTQTEPFRFGVWVDGDFSWLTDDWRIDKDYLDDSLVTRVVLTSNRHALRIIANDLVDFQENIYLKRLSVENLAPSEREVRLFFGQSFTIYGNEIGDTAVYRPDVKALLHYKGDRYFLINTFANKKFGVEHFATGKIRQTRFEGTWKDAEDGHLSGNPIAQGSVDSVVGIHLQLAAKGSESCDYWICAGKNWQEVNQLNSVIIGKKPAAIFKRTKDYWKLWTNKENLNYDLLPGKLAWLYKRSLMIARTQIDNCGSIIAANDSDVVYFNRDTYSYMWPRDAALVAYAFDLSGYHEITRRFFNLASKVIEKDGYFLHKYTPAGALASSWHPWLKDGSPQLPIQEDETALVIWALWQHYQRFADIEFIKPLYKPLIKNAANMMMSYRDSDTKLPLPSYDLWEERHGILSYTCATVYGGLMAAANFTDAFGENELAEEYRQGANDLRKAMDDYLYLKDEKRFARMINFRKDGGVDVDAAVDASFFALFAFGAYSADDERIQSTMAQVYDKLWCKTTVGGLARYENDSYHRASYEVPGNPWFITTLWYAQYEIARAKSKEDLARAVTLMNWVADRTLASGVLAEQVHPYSNAPLSVSPLTWSHASFLIVANEYINKLLEIERCECCGHPKYSRRKLPPHPA